MAAEVTAAKILLLRRLVTKEADRRQQRQSASRGVVDTSRRDESVTIDAGPSSVTIEDVERIERENAQLKDMLKEERARNDVEWEDIRETMSTLEQPANLDDDSLVLKQTELALLEHEIATLSSQLPNLEPPLNDFAMILRTREILGTSIEQHQSYLRTKQAELDRQIYLLQQDQDIWHNLKDVRIGLKAKMARLHQKEEEAQDQGSALDTLRQRVTTVEASLGRFLTAVIEVCDSLYEDRDQNKREQLKHLIDRLVNAAWDSPDNPWINISEQYLPSIVTFLIRANIAIEDPRDARNLRLVDFHR